MTTSISAETQVMQILSNIEATQARLVERSEHTQNMVEKIEKRMGKHDDRIRVVEGKSKMYAGIAIAVSTLFGWFSKHLSP